MYGYFDSCDSDDKVFIKLVGVLWDESVLHSNMCEIVRNEAWVEFVSRLVVIRENSERNRKSIFYHISKS